MLSIVTLALDVIMIGLLVTAVRYAVRLSHQFTLMQDAREDMRRFVIDFNATIARVEKSVDGMKTSARAVGDDLEDLINQGKSLKDELKSLAQSADRIADRLAARPAQAPVRDDTLETDHMRKAQAVLDEIRAMAGAPTGGLEDRFASKAERDLMEALARQG